MLTTGMTDLASLRCTRGLMLWAFRHISTLIERSGMAGQRLVIGEFTMTGKEVAVDKAGSAASSLSPLFIPADDHARSGPQR
jgi:hypothetical protein